MPEDMAVSEQSYSRAVHRALRSASYSNLRAALKDDANG